MMKKMKGVVAAASMERTPVFSGYDDPRARFRHQSLMQDYEELLKVLPFVIGFDQIC